MTSALLTVGDQGPGHRRRSIASGSSTASFASTRRGRGTMAVPVWDWRSRNGRSKSTAARSPSRSRPARGPPFASPCQSQGQQLSPQKRGYEHESLASGGSRVHTHDYGGHGRVGTTRGCDGHHGSYLSVTWRATPRRAAKPTAGTMCPRTRAMRRNATRSRNTSSDCSINYRNDRRPSMKRFVFVPFLP